MNQFDQLASMYDLDMTDKTAGISMYLDYANVQGSPVLQLGCGVGRLLLPIASEGIDIYGVDSSEPMLEFVRSEMDMGPDDVKERITLIEHELPEFQQDMKFNLILIAFNSFLNLLTRKDQQQTLVNVNNMLTDDGLLIIDILTPKHGDLAREWLRRKDVPIYRGLLYDEETSTTYVRNDRVRVNLTDQIQETEMIYDTVYPDGRIEKAVRIVQTKYIFRSEMEILLESTGFNIRNFFSNYDSNQEFNYDDSSSMVFVAEKRPT